MQKKKENLCTTHEDLISFTINTSNLWVNQIQTESLLLLYQLEKLRDQLPFITLKESIVNCTKSGNKGKFCPYYQEIKNQFELDDLPNSFREFFDNEYYPLFLKSVQASAQPKYIYLNNSEGFDLYPIDDVMVNIKNYSTSNRWEIHEMFFPGDSGSILIDEHGVPVETISTLGNEELSDGFAMTELPPPRRRKKDGTSEVIPSCD